MRSYVKGRGCGTHRGVIWPALISGLSISDLSDTGVSPGRRFQPLIFGLAMAIWALTHFAGHDSRDPSGLTLAHQPARSDHTPMQPAMGSRASGRLSGCQGFTNKAPVKGLGALDSRYREWKWVAALQRAHEIAYPSTGKVILYAGSQLVVRHLGNNLAGPRIDHSPFVHRLALQGG